MRAPDRSQALIPKCPARRGGPVTRMHRRQRGMTLIELMVSMTLGLLLSGAVTALYLTTRQTSRQGDALTQMNANAQMVMDLIGRDIQMAAYYPAPLPRDTSAAAAHERGTYFNSVTSAPSAYNDGLFGCEAASFDPSTPDCATSAGATAPDSIVISYFSDDHFGSGSRLGLQNDCLGQPVDTSATSYNEARRADDLPVQIVNHYALVTQTLTLDSSTITTKALACQGNGKPTGSYVAIASGIEDLQLSYGVAETAGSLSPSRFYNATGVGTKWPQVTAVKVCLLVRSIEAVRMSDKGGTSARTYVDCQGNTQTLGASNRALFRRYEQVFAVRNRLTGRM
jgi:type IV pilus assembly protein PilW